MFHLIAFYYTLSIFLVNIFFKLFLKFLLFAYFLNTCKQGQNSNYNLVPTLAKSAKSVFLKSSQGDSL